MEPIKPISLLSLVYERDASDHKEQRKIMKIKRLEKSKNKVVKMDVRHLS